MNRREIGSLPLPAVALHAAAGAVLVAAAAPALDSSGTAQRVLQGVAVLLAAMLALAVDEPGAEVLDATSTPFAVRVARRLALLGCVAVPLWLVALGVVALRGADVPVLLLTLQAVTLLTLALAVSAGLRRWRRVVEPGIAAGPVLLGFSLGIDRLPRSLAVQPLQSWGPPWEVTHLRWAALLLACLSVLLVAMSDPATAVRRRPA